MGTNNIIEQLSEKYPFMSLCVYANIEYVGIVQNADNVFLIWAIKNGQHYGIN